jgi:hypothetical protein
MEEIKITFEFKNLQELSKFVVMSFMNLPCPRPFAM